MGIRGLDGIWGVGEMTLWYVEGVVEGDNRIAAPDIPVYMDLRMTVKESVDSVSVCYPNRMVRCNIVLVEL